MFACQLSSHLNAKGHIVMLVALFDGPANHLYSADITRISRPPAMRLFDWKGYRTLAKLIGSFDPEIVQANAGDTLKYAVLSRMIFRWKSKIVFRNANKVSDFVSPGPKKWFNRMLVDRVDHVISVSELCRLDFVKTYKLDQTRTTTITIGIETDIKQHALATDLSEIFQQGKVLLHVASFVPEKNHEGLLRIAQKLAKQNVDFQLLLVGEGKLRVQVEKQIIVMGLSDRVHLVGYRKDVADLMTHSSAVVLPSLIEGLPGVILEAMHCKTPVIAYNVGGISEVVKDGETGWLTAKDDEDGFVKAVVEVLQGINVERMRSNAYDMVVTNYDNSVVAEKFEAVYERLVKDQ